MLLYLYTGIDETFFQGYFDQVRVQYCRQARACCYTMLCITACLPSILVTGHGRWHRCRAQIIVSPTTAQTRLPLFKLWNRNCKSSCEQWWWRYVDLITNNNHILQNHIECWSMTSIHRCFSSCCTRTRHKKYRKTNCVNYGKSDKFSYRSWTAKFSCVSSWSITF